MSGNVRVTVVYPGGERQQLDISSVSFSAVWGRVTLLSIRDNTFVKKFSDLEGDGTYLLVQQADGERRFIVCVLLIQADN